MTTQTFTVKDQTERMTYLYSIAELARRPALLAAVSLLSSWSEGAEGKNVAAAACHYLTHFVVPTMQGEDCTGKRIPEWVDALLFHPVTYGHVETTHEDWMRFFGANCSYVREDRDGGFVLQNQYPNDAMNLLSRKAGAHFLPGITGDTPTLGHTSVRSVDNIQAMTCFFADLDGDKAEGWQIIQGLPLRPSVVVETRRGWHLYWALNAPHCVEEWLRVQSTIVEATKGDRGVLTPNHSMRMPNSWHCKEMWKGGEPFWVHIAWASWRKYSYAEVELEFPPKPVPKAVRREFTPTDGVRLPSTNYLPKGGSFEPLTSEVARVYAGIKMENAAAARRIAVDWYMSFKENKQPSDEREVNRWCDRLETKQFGRVVSR